MKAHLRREERQKSDGRVAYSRTFMCSCKKVFRRTHIYDKLWSFDKDGDLTIITELISKKKFFFIRKEY